MPLESYWLRCISVVSFRFKTSRGSFLYLLRSVLGATHVLLPLFPNPLAIPARIVLTVALSLVIFPLLLAQSLASKRVVYATGLSLVTYVAWLGFVTYAHIHGTLHANSGLFRLGIFWEGISMFFFSICSDFRWLTFFLIIATIAFAFTSSSTLPLYASLKGTTQPITTVKTPRTRSFKILSVLSVSMAILLTFPLILFSANPNNPETVCIFPFLSCH